MTQEGPPEDLNRVNTENTEPPAAESLDKLEMPPINALADGITPDELAKGEMAKPESSFSFASMIRNLDPRYLHYLVVTPNEYLSDGQVWFKTAILALLVFSPADILPDIIPLLGIGDDLAYTTIIAKNLTDSASRALDRMATDNKGKVPNWAKGLKLIIKVPGFPGWLAERIFNLLPRNDNKFKGRGKNK